MTPYRSSPVATLLLSAIAAVCAACASPGKYVWVDAYSDSGAPASPETYVISPGDLLQIRVFNQDELTTRVRVRPDGRISMPLLHDVSAAGLTPMNLAKDMNVRLKDFVKTPLVTVAVEETRPAMIYVAGEVAHPGAFPLDASAGVLQAIVNAGGPTQTASLSRIFVLRPQETRIRFTYEALTRLEGKAAAFKLRAGDVVVVE